MCAEVRGTMRPRLAPFARLQWDAVRERHVVLLPEKVVLFNATGAAILARCDGRRTVAGIAAELRAAYSVGGDAVERDVVAFLQRMARTRLVVLDADERDADERCGGTQAARPLS